MALVARLHALDSGRKHAVEFQGELIIVCSRNAEFDAARVLVARGFTDPLTFLDGVTGKPRLVIKDLEKAAQLTVEENQRIGPRFKKWRPMPEIAHQTSEGRAPAGEAPTWGVEGGNFDEVA